MKHISRELGILGKLFYPEFYEVESVADFNMNKHDIRETDGKFIFGSRKSFRGAAIVNFTDKALFRYEEGIPYQETLSKSLLPFGITSIRSVDGCIEFEGKTEVKKGVDYGQYIVSIGIILAQHQAKFGKQRASLSNGDAKTEVCIAAVTNKDHLFPEGLQNNRELPFPLCAYVPKADTLYLLGYSNIIGKASGEHNVVKMPTSFSAAFNPV